MTVRATLWHYLASHAGAETNAIAEALGMTRQQALSSLRDLRLAGYIVRESPGLRGQCARWRIADDTGAPVDGRISNGGDRRWRVEFDVPPCALAECWRSQR